MSRKLRHIRSTLIDDYTPDRNKAQQLDQTDVTSVNAVELPPISGDGEAEQST